MENKISFENEIDFAWSLAVELGDSCSVRLQPTDARFPVLGLTNCREQAPNPLEYSPLRYDTASETACIGHSTPVSSRGCDADQAPLECE